MKFIALGTILTIVACIIALRIAPLLGLAVISLLYPITIVGSFLVNLTTVVSFWLAGCAITMLAQIVYVDRINAKHGISRVGISSLYLWPFQLILQFIQAGSGQDKDKVRSHSLEKIGPLPATISGTVGFTHHIGTEEGIDMVFLEELEELPIYLASGVFDTLDIAEGKVVTLNLQEKDGSEFGESSTVIWAVDGAVKSNT